MTLRYTSSNFRITAFFVVEIVLFQLFFGVFRFNQTQVPLPVKVNSQAQVYFR